MPVKILDRIKRLFSVSVPDGHKKEFVTDVNRSNMIKLKITAITFISLEAMMTVVHHIVNRGNLFAAPYIYYGSMYIVMLAAMTAFLVIAVKLGRDVPKYITVIRYAGVVFIGFILMWCAGISLLDQMSSGQVIVYVVAIIAVAITPIFKPAALLLTYALVHSAFLLIIPHVQASAELLFMNSVNTTAFVIMSWAISFMRYKRAIEEYNNRQIIMQKNHELNVINLQLQAANQRLEILSRTDGLTGVFNRATFDEKINDEWDRCKGRSVPLSLIIADIDLFKEYNDNYGHQAGDYCLKQIAGVLTACVKSPSDMVARFGGEEFVILLPHSDNEDALKLAEKIRTGVEEAVVPHLYSGISDHVTISLGVNSVIPSEESSVYEFINDADVALYKAKERRNCSVSAVTTA